MQPASVSDPLVVQHAEPLADLPGTERPPGGAQVAGLGIALPARVVPNDEIGSRAGIDDAWIVRRTGISRRHHAEPGDRLSDLAAEAALAALADANVAAEELDLILVATCSGDTLTPGTSPLVAAAIGADRAGALDVDAACAGFVSALALGTAMIEARRARRVLVIGAEILSRHTDFTDRRTAALFGDGAGAIVLEGAGRAAVGPVTLGADGEAAELIVAPRETGLIVMDGPEVFRHAVARMGAAAREACLLAGATLDDVDLFVFHQANARILAALSEQLELPPERVVNAIGELGNTSAASVPLALAQARDEGRLADGSRVLLAAFGAGLTWAATLVTWGRDA
jgi:3-oxoacyl-[acyl-carrier-protein] synthase-3